MPGESDESVTRVRRTYPQLINTLCLETSVLIIDISGNEAAIGAGESGAHELSSGEEFSPDPDHVK